MRSQVRWMLVPALLLAAGAAMGQEATTRPAASQPADPVAAIQAVTPSLVKVEYTLQYDKGESPRGGGWYAGGYGGFDGAQSIRDERPVEIAGFLIGPKTVVTPDALLHRRFVKGLAVRYGKQVVTAKVAGYAKTHGAVLLELSEPLKDAKPLAFDAARKGPYLAIAYGRSNAVWTITASALTPSAAVTETNRKYMDAPSCCLITDAKGAAVGLSMRDEMPLDDSWKGSPAKWPAVTEAELAKSLEGLQAAADQCLLRVKINFRSPPKGRRSRYGPDEGTVTETDAVGVLLDSGQVMVLAYLKPNVTARLERVQLYPAKGDPLPAKFGGTLTDYGAFLAAPEKPLPGGVALSGADVMDFRNVLLPAAQIILRGEQRLGYYAHRRIGGYSLGWRQHVYPNVAGEEESTFVFDPQGKLLVLPIARREKVTGERGYESDRGGMTAAAYLKDVLTDLAKNTDASNVPLTEEQENRLAWLGVELQPLDSELARANNVSDETRDGSTGALVSYVYPGSPADAAGVKPGMILLRLHVADVPKPIEVAVEEYGFSSRPFPWDRLDSLPERYYDEIPTPWPPSENNFTRILTDLGFGKKYAAEFFVDGKSAKKDFEVVQSPAHYETAAKFKSPALGLTVREMTYEVRRYFQKKDDDLGVIAAKIEPGGKASVAGIKPYELVTHVNDKPIRTVKDFEQAIDKQDELRLSVLRMTKGRTVPIKGVLTASQPADAGKTTTRPAKPPAPEDME